MKARKYAAIILLSLCCMGKSFANEIVDAMLYFPTPSMGDFLKESCSKKIFTSRYVSFFLDNTYMYASDHGAPAEFYMGVFSVKSKIKTKELFFGKYRDDVFYIEMSNVFHFQLDKKNHWVRTDVDYAKNSKNKDVFLLQQGKPQQFVMTLPGIRLNGDFPTTPFRFVIRSSRDDGVCFLSDDISYSIPKGYLKSLKGAK